MAPMTDIKRSIPRAERRRYPRLSKKATILGGEVTYPIDADNFARGISENISLGGIMVNTDERFEKGSLIQVQIALPGWHKHHPGFLRVLEGTTGNPLTAICEVLRCEESGQGYSTAAKFINIDPEDFVAFQGYLEEQMTNI